MMSVVPIVCEYALHEKFMHLLDFLSIYQEDLRKYHIFSKNDQCHV